MYVPSVPSSRFTNDVDPCEQARGIKFFCVCGDNSVIIDPGETEVS